MAMKLTAILLLTACLQVSAKGYTQSISLNMQNAPLEEVVKEIKRQTKFNFFYERHLFQNAKPVTVAVSNKSLDETLELCFSGQQFEYKIVKNTVFVKRKEVINIEQPGAAKVDNGDFKGRVLTKEGEPLASANVVNKRTGKGTTTDANGNFILKEVNISDILLITYTGFSPRSIKVSEFNTVTLVLEPAINELDQVVMQAYGTTTQRFNTGNIAKVTSEEISKQPVINPLQALQGRVPGLVVTQTNGYGSAPFKVEIRGRNNLNSSFTSDPLYIIDGVPLSISEVGGNSSYSGGSTGFIQNLFVKSPAGGQSPLFSLNPGDIESIEVLKDADATSIYGSRGANGVILITTKKGKPGKAKLNVSVSHGISAVTRYWEMLNTQQYVEMRKEAFANDRLTPSSNPGATIPNWYAPDIMNWDTTRYTNWQKKIWGNLGKVTDARIGLSGGNNQSTFWISSGYNRRTDITTASGSDERISASLGVSFRSLNQKFSLTINNNFSFSKSDMIFNAGNLALLPPNAPDIIDSDGKPNFSEWSPLFYPFSALFQPYTAKTNFLNTSLNFGYQILKGLNLRSNFGYNSAIIKQEQKVPIFSQDPTSSPLGSSSWGNNENKNWVIEPQLEYNTFISKGKLSALIGATVQNNTTDGQSVQGFNYTSDLLLNSISSAPTKTANEFYGEYKYSALFGRINYNWANKYLINISGRRDGSSRFGPGKQFGNYSAIGIAWIFSEETWIKKINKRLDLFSYGKIRASYGATGSDIIGDYQYLSRWSSSNTQPYGGNSSLIPTQHYNNQYHWPTNKKLEAAIDLGLLNDRLSLSFSCYQNRCNDQLVDFPLAIYTGFNSVVANSPANVENSGFEILLNAKLLERKKISWSISLNAGFNKNKLISYPNIEQSPYFDTYIIGKPLNITKTLHYLGVDKQTGKYTYEDKNKDGIISRTTDSTDDRYIVNLNPKFTGGIGFNFKYKGAVLNLFFYYIKQTGVNALNSTIVPGAASNTSAYVFENRWRKQGDESSIAKFVIRPDQTFRNFRQSDGIYTDASYIRLSNLSLSYDLSEKLIRSSKLPSIQLRITGQNLFTITSYKGIDPETQNFGGMPPVKVITAGINFNF